MGEEDSRSWTAELLQSIGRSGDIVSSLMGAKSQFPEETVDLGSWREILIHLRTHYPIGLVSQVSDVQFQDQMDPSHLGALNRVRSMRSDLQDVINYKREKIGVSSSGKKLSETIKLKETQLENSRDEQAKASINLYAENLSIQLEPSTKDPPDDEENLSGYDSISLKSSATTNPSVLLSEHLGPNFKLKS